MIKADLLVNLEELEHYELLTKIAIHEQISLFEAIDFVLSKVEIEEDDEDICKQREIYASDVDLEE